MTQLHAFLVYSLWGAPVWAWFALGGLGAVEYTLPRLRSPRARSIGELVANGLSKILGRFPVLGPVLRSLGTPQPADAPPLPLPPPGSSARVLLPLAFLGAALSSGCHAVDWKKFGVDEAQCLVAPAKGAIADASSALVDSIEKQINGGNGFESQAWADEAKALGIKYGFAAVACAAAHLVGDVFIAGPEQVCKLKHKPVKPEHLPYLRKLLPKR